MNAKDARDRSVSAIERRKNEQMESARKQLDLFKLAMLDDAGELVNRIRDVTASGQFAFSYDVVSMAERLRQSAAFSDLDIDKINRIILESVVKLQGLGYEVDIVHGKTRLIFPLSLKIKW
jgi:hypothetical protein